MKQWIQNIENHPYYSTLKDLQEYLDGYPVPESDETAREALSRIQAIMQHVDRILKAADPSFLSPQRLSQLQKTIESVKSELAEYLTDNSAGHFVNVHNSADTILELATRIPIISAPEDASRLIKAAKIFREKSDKLVEELAINTQSSLDNLKSKTEKVEHAIGTIQQMQQSLTDELNATKSEIEAQKGRIDATISDFQQQFSMAEDRRRQQFEQITQSLNDKSSAAATDLRNELNDNMNAWHKDAENVINTLNHKKKEAIDLVHVIGNIGITGNFKEVADKERISANSWRITAVIFMILIVLGVGSTIWIAVKPDFDWQQVAIRIAVTLALAVPATYAARESSGHRKVERATRRLELELASLDPYLEKLPEEQRNEVRKKLTERFFGSIAEADPQHGKAVAPQADVFVTALKEAMDTLKRAIDQLAKR